MLKMLPSATVAASEPAGGAEVSQIIIATAGATIVTLALLVLAHGHRTGRLPFLTRASALSERISGLPGWVALPTALAGAALACAAFGMYWDISLHIDNGRDAGPLANPGHYFILAGLFGIFAAGVLAIVLPGDEVPGKAAVKLAEGWHAPVGGVLMLASAGFSLTGFPLDDVWHRIFGQDVTLWGPTHLMLLGGAAMCLVAMMVLLCEGMNNKPAPGETSQSVAGVEPLRFPGPIQSALDKLAVLEDQRVRQVALMGGFLIGLSIFQAEFDWGVPQYRAVFHPMMLAFAGATALVAARLWIGRGAALGAAVFYIVFRSGLALLVGPGLGQTTPLIPLYLAEAVIVELVALRLARKPLAFGAVSGLLIGTVGFAANYGWTQIGFRIPWTPDMLPEGVVAATAVGGVSGMVGVVLVQGLRGDLPGPRIARAVPVAALITIFGFCAWGLRTTEPSNATAAVTLTHVKEGPQREAGALVRFSPSNLADDASWVSITGWQGKGFHIDHLEKVREGVWQTTKPLPLYGDWKSVVRVHKGDQLLGIPVYMPEDTAIPAPEVPALPQFTRTFIHDTEILQRERDFDVPGWLWAGAVSLVILLYVALLTALAWGVGRIGRRYPQDPDAGPPAVSAPPAPPREREPVAVA